MDEQPIPGYSRARINPPFLASDCEQRRHSMIQALMHARLAAQHEEEREIVGLSWKAVPHDWRPGTASSDAAVWALIAYDELLLNGITPCMVPMGRHEGG